MTLWSLSFADRGDHLVLKASWTKGGRERTVPVRTEGQREVLDRARRLAGLGSLIPSDRNYVHQMRVYEAIPAVPDSLICMAYAMPMPRTAMRS